MKSLKELSKSLNIAEDLDEMELKKIGQSTITGFNDDFASSQEWLQDVKRVMELSSLKSAKKNVPLPNSANVKYPLITKACYEFSSRTYPEIIKDGKVVKTRVIGKDLDGSKDARAQRVENYMNWQLLVESEEWELELDRLLTTLALIGFVCKKTYYDPVCKINKSVICEYEDLIINSKVKSMQDARRISHVLHMHLNDLIEMARAEVFLEETVDELIDRYSELDVKPTIDIVEQHRFLDLDEDGYEEPYIVTIVKETGQVLRIAARYESDDIYTNSKGKVKYITPIQYFTDFHFLVSPTGKFQSVGFGILMLHLNESINTILNQLIDAGQLANLQGGYIDSRLKPLNSGETLHDPGEWKKIKADPNVNIKDGIVPIVYKEPSQVLFNLLGMLIEAGRELSSSTEVMTGSSGTDNVKTGAVMALQQEGLKVFNSIQRRVYRSLGQEYKKLFHLNSLYLDPIQYVTALDDDVRQDDFDEEKLDITPVADPNLSSDIQKQQKLSMLTQMPQLDQLEVAKRVLETLNIPNPEALMPKEQGPNPEVVKLQADIEAKAQELNMKGKELEIKQKQQILDTIKLEADIAKIKADTMKSLADAEATDASTSLADLQMQLDMFSKQIEMMSVGREQANADFKLMQEAQAKQQEAVQQQEAQVNGQQAPTAQQPPGAENMAGAPSQPSPGEIPPGG